VNPQSAARARRVKRCRQSERSHSGGDLGVFNVVLGSRAGVNAFEQHDSKATSIRAAHLLTLGTRAWHRVLRAAAESGRWSTTTPLTNSAGWRAQMRRLRSSCASRKEVPDAMRRHPGARHPWTADAQSDAAQCLCKLASDNDDMCRLQFVRRTSTTRSEGIALLRERRGAAQNGSIHNYRSGCEQERKHQGQGRVPRG
jgi:hypothetical protein